MDEEGYWEDGYWKGPMRDGYPADYFSEGRFQFPWEKQLETPTAPKSDHSNTDKEAKQ